MAPSPAKLEQIDAGHLGIVWSDGARRRYTVRHLRIECPCASCISEVTGERILDPESVAANVHPVGIEAIGLYALKFSWSDGHSTGLYTYAILREKGDEWPEGS